MKSRAQFSLGVSETHLAKTQGLAIAARLQAAHPRLACEVMTVPWPRSLEARGAFLVESAEQAARVDQRLLAGDFRLALRRATDLRLPLADGLLQAAVLERETPYDAFLNRQGQITDEMPPGSVVGVLNLRSKAQMQALWPQLEIRLLSGGVEAAVEAMLRQSLVEGLVLPAAVTEHLGIQAVVTELYYPELMVPSAGQGILVLLARADDKEARELARALHSPATGLELEAELAFLERMASDQDVPAGVLAQVEGKRVTVTGAVASPSGGAVNRVTRQGPATQTAAMGAAVAEELLQNADALIDLLEADFPDGLPAAELDESIMAELDGNLTDDLEEDLAGDELAGGLDDELARLGIDEELAAEAGDGAEDADDAEGSGDGRRPGKRPRKGPGRAGG